MAASEQIIIEYIAQVEGMKAQLRTVQTELKNVENQGKESAKKTSDAYTSAGAEIKKVGLEIATTLGIAFSIEKVIEFAKESVKAFNEAQEVAEQLEFALTKIGKEGVAAFEKLTKQADKLSKISIFSDEDIKKAQTQLLQFGLTSKEVEKLIPQIIDLASATHKDLGGATDLAIQGINGIGRGLKQYGIIATDTGNITKNLSAFQQQLTKFTGASEEAFKSAAGQQKFFDNQINELQESIGSKLSPVIQGLEKGTLKYFDVLLNFVQSDIFKNIASTLTSTFSTPISLISSLIDQFKGETKKAAEELSEDDKKFIEQYQTRNAEAERAKHDSTAKGIADAAELRKKANEEAVKDEKKFQELSEELKPDLDQQFLDAQNERDEAFKAEDEAEKAKRKLYEDTQKYQKELLDGVLDKNKENAAKQKEIDEQAIKDKEDIRNAEFDLASTAANSIFEYQNQLDDAQISNLDESLKRGVISQQKYDSEVADIKLKAAKRDRAQAIFNIALNTAKAVVEALPNLVLSGLVAAIGAVELAAVISKPLPGFAKGVIDLQGGVRGKDSIGAMLMPGESVMTTAETERHGDLLRSIRSNKLDNYLMDNYINPKLSAILGNSTAENMAKSAQLNGLDEYSLARVMSRNKGVNLQNADYLASKIASEISRKTGNKTIWY